MSSLEIPSSIRALTSHIRQNGAHLPAVETAATHSMQRTLRLASGVRELDESLSGGLPFGSLIEWGTPVGQGGRELLIPWLREATYANTQLSSPAWVLWAYATQRLVPYPPAWSARGIALERLRFAQTNNPILDLHPVFLEPLFRIIILDVPRSFSPEEYAFMTRQARLHNQIIILVREKLLKPDEGNIWARIRLNTWFVPESGTHHIEILKGSSTRRLNVTL